MRLESSSKLTKRRIETVKDAVSVATLARDLIEENAGRLRVTGTEIRGQCPICLNGNHSEAFSVSVKENFFYCHACGEGGDVVKLAALTHGMGPGEAATWLGYRYGIDLPARPESWFRKQDRQAREREAIREARRDIKRRRLFRYFILPDLEQIEDPGERERQTILAWDDFKGLPVND